MNSMVFKFYILVGAILPTPRPVFNLTTISFIQNEGLIFDEDFNIEKRVNLHSYSSFHLSNDFIYTSSLITLYIYDLKFNHLTSIQTESIIGSMFDHLNYLFLQTSSNILIFDSNSFNFVSYIDIPFHFIRFSDEKLIFSDLNEFIFVYTINLGKKNRNSIFNQNFICKINKFQPHLFSNPYLLPCNNSACLDCIYEHYNIHLNLFKCTFDSCNAWHKLPYEMKKDLELNEKINENSHEILKDIIIDAINLTGIIFFSFRKL